jgi:hypothetical protein
MRRADFGFATLSVQVSDPKRENERGLFDRVALSVSRAKLAFFKNNVAAHSNSVAPQQ